MSEIKENFKKNLLNKLEKILNLIMQSFKIIDIEKITNKENMLLVYELLLDVAKKVINELIMELKELP